MLEFSQEFATIPPEQQALIRRTAARLLPAVIEPAASPEQEYSHTVEGMARKVRDAKAAGFLIIEGSPNTLLLDLDGDARINEGCLKLLCELVKEEPTLARWASKDGRGTHMVLRFEKTTFTVAEAIALEASLGSDCKRAMLCVVELKNGVVEPRVLFQPAAHRERVSSGENEEEGRWSTDSVKVSV